MATVWRPASALLSGKRRGRSGAPAGPQLRRLCVGFQPWAAASLALADDVAFALVAEWPTTWPVCLLTTLYPFAALRAVCGMSR